jgi:hypothetical protein
LLVTTTLPSSPSPVVVQKVRRKKLKTDTILVESDSRRISLRVKKQNKGFEKNTCNEKNYIACREEPPNFHPQW